MTSTPGPARSKPARTRSWTPPTPSSELPFVQAFSVLSTVISVSKDWAVADCGLKALGMDHGNPVSRGCGRVVLLGRARRLCAGDTTARLETGFGCSLPMSIPPWRTTSASLSSTAKTSSTSGRSTSGAGSSELQDEPATHPARFQQSMGFGSLRSGQGSSDSQGQSTPIGQIPEFIELVVLGRVVPHEDREEGDASVCPSPRHSRAAWPSAPHRAQREQRPHSSPLRRSNRRPRRERSPAPRGQSPLPGCTTSSGAQRANQGFVG